MRIPLKPFSGFITGFVSVLGPTLVMWYGGLEVMKGNLTIGSFIAFTSYLGYIYGPVRRIFDLNITIQTALAGVERVIEIMNMKEEHTLFEPQQSSLSLKGYVKFEDVHFNYISGREVLKGVSFEAKPGMIIAIVGESGVGKTTLVKLIPRFYDSTDGRILIDGKDVREFDLRFLRKNIGIVFQEPFFFSGTIRENIAYARNNAKEEEIEETARIAQIHDFVIGLPNKYETEVGERGVKLSGGQRQRMAIARVILSNPKILILDEAIPITVHILLHHELFLHTRYQKYLPLVRFLPEKFFFPFASLFAPMVYTAAKKLSEEKWSKKIA